MCIYIYIYIHVSLYICNSAFPQPLRESLFRSGASALCAAARFDVCTVCMYMCVYMYIYIYISYIYIYIYIYVHIK